ncbi:MAG: hypothetical protein MSC30_08520 [Gaiellaceae bacterium MAG52_C11]|nr:hypothetical protein [Candidatus Gaiellasilicea maunaloa]
MVRRRLHRVAGAEPIGPYTLLRLERGDSEPGEPGQFFMLEAPGRVLPRPMSLCLATRAELAFLIDPIGPGTSALCELEQGEELHLLGPLGHGFDLAVERPLLVGGGIGLAPLPFLSKRLARAGKGRPPAILGFRSEWHAEAAALLPDAEVCIEPTFVTALLPDERHDVLACGPEPMLVALRVLVPTAQLAWESPMACGYGACHGCVVELDGELRRLCVDGPVLRHGGTHGSPTSPLLRRAGTASRTRAPAGRAGDSAWSVRP